MAPRNDGKPKRTLYHGEFAKMGPTRVTVKTDVLESKFKKGTYYVTLIIDGHERDYTIENEACSEFWTGHVGQTFTVEADGFKETAGFNFLDDTDPGSLPPQEQQEQAPPTQHRNPPPQQRNQQQQTRQAPPQQSNGQNQQRKSPPPPPPKDPAKELLKFKIAVAQGAVMQTVTLMASIKLSRDFKRIAGFEMPADLFQSINASLFIMATRTAPHDLMPLEVEVDEHLKVSIKQKTQAAPPVAPPVSTPPKGNRRQPPKPASPPTEPEPGEPAEPVDEVPF